MKNTYSIILFCLLMSQIYSQDIKIEKIEPPNWWIDMNTNQIQLMLYGQELSDIRVHFNTDKIKINQIHKIKNNTYAFIDIEILPDCKPADYILTINSNDSELDLKFPVYERIQNDKRHLGFNSEDIIYLITPDRFANGDAQNDNVEGMRDHTDRSDILRRHGGDIQGIIDKLDYIKDLGFTTIWINPLIENDMDISYHGYASTDLYNIDPRFGSNGLYKELVEISHSKGLKIIMDHVSNHVGMYHDWVKNPPAEDWFHGDMENHLYAKHDKRVLVDLYSDSSTIENMKEGWFVSEMPDLNQSNKYLKKYLIQNTIWWIETTGIDGIREDTYPYVEQQFLSDWARMIFDEYSNFNIVGEIWINDPVFLAPFQKNSNVKIDSDTYLPSVTDFGLMEAIGKLLHQEKSIYNVYDCLSKDYLYDNPKMLVTFLDNHDVMRLWDLVSCDVNKYKMALVMLFTLRGIPQVYYGTEIGLQGGNDHGLIRRDMPGGFSGDKVNVFEYEGLNNIQQDLFQFIKILISLRKENKALSIGTMNHMRPHNEVYSYIRTYQEESILILINAGKRQQRLNFEEFQFNKNKIINTVDLINNNKLEVQKKQYVDIDGFGFKILKIGEN